MFNGLIETGLGGENYYFLQVPVRPVRRSKAEIHGLWKQTSKALLLKNQLQSQPSETIANLTLYTLNR